MMEAADLETHRCNHSQAPIPNMAENIPAFKPISHGGIAKLSPDNTHVAFINSIDSGRNTKSCMGGGSGTGATRSVHFTACANSNTQTDTSSTPQNIQKSPMHKAHRITMIGLSRNTAVLIHRLHDCEISHPRNCSK